MKRPEICPLIFVILAACYLAACTSGGSAFNRINCSSGGEICITITPVEPMHFADPVTVMIKVTSSKDISDLHVSLHTLPVVKVDGPRDWESNLSSRTNDPGIATWDFTIKAGQTLTFNRVLHFPPEVGYFDVGVRVATIDQTLVGVDSFTVHTAHDEKYYKAGTPVPLYTPNVTVAAYGPGTPFPTLVRATYPWEAAPSVPTTTRVPTIAPTPSGFVPRGGTPYPGPSPYP